jgi:hypothetical protein
MTETAWGWAHGAHATLVEKDDGWRCVWPRDGGDEIACAEAP